MKRCVNCIVKNVNLHESKHYIAQKLSKCTLNVCVSDIKTIHKLYIVVDTRQLSTYRLNVYKPYVLDHNKIINCSMEKY